MFGLHPTSSFMFSHFAADTQQSFRENTDKFAAFGGLPVLVNSLGWPTKLYTQLKLNILGRFVAFVADLQTPSIS